MRGMNVSGPCPAGNEWLWNCNRGALAATGTNQSNAFAIPLGQDLTVFSSVPSGTGCILPAGIGLVEEYAVANHGANALLVYPPVGGTLGTAGTNAAYSLPAGKTGYFMRVDSGNQPVSPPAFTVSP